MPVRVCKELSECVHRQRNSLQAHMGCVGSSKTSPLVLVGSSLDAVTVMIILRISVWRFGQLLLSESW